ncbi:MAG: radical SAM protein [Candidatus Omnitrophota bacterium]
MKDVYKLKISLMSNGVQITPEALHFLTGDENNPLSVFDYVTTSGLLLILPGNVYVNANFMEDFCKRSPNILDFSNKPMIRSPFGNVDVSWLPVPSYHNKTLPSGKPATEVIMTHADRARISPIRGCSNRCQFCDLGTSHPYQKASIEDIDAAMDIAWQDSAAKPKHILISGGTPYKQDEAYLDGVYEHVIKKCPVPVDVMMAPREDTRILHRLHDWGCEGLSINLEIEDEASAQKIIPEKYRIGRAKYLEFIEKAVAVFGRGKVRSCIILGLEDEKATLNGVERLAQIGCDPVLSSFKPLKGTILENILSPDVVFQEAVYEQAEKIAEHHGVLLGPRCIPCQHNTLTFPLENRGYFFY